MDNLEKSLFLILGPEGAGKRSFFACYKNSFLKCLPLMTLEEGISKNISFSFLSKLDKEENIAFLLRKAHQKGYRIIVYLLFGARLLLQERNRFLYLSKGEFWSKEGFREEYETFYNKIIYLYSNFDLVFFVTNQKEFAFSGVYSVSKVSISAFEKTLRKQKASVDKLSLS